MNKNTEADKKRHRISVVVSIAFHAIFIIICGLGFISCWEQPVPFEVPGTIGVSFGDSDLGSGDNTEMAENPVVEPSQTDQNTDAVSPVTDADSDLPAEKISSKPVNNTSKPTTSSSKPTASTNTHTMSGDQGHGNSNIAGNQGMSHGQGGTGSGGQGNHGDGSGLKLTGWDFASKPKTDEIQTSGTAQIIFTINRFGKILNCTVTGPFSESEKQIIKETFMTQTVFKKSSNNDSNAPFLKGTFEWVFKF